MTVSSQQASGARLVADRGSRPRVLHLGKGYPPDAGGIERIVQLLCEGLQPEFEAVVVVSGRGRPARREVLRRVELVWVRSWGQVASQPLCPGVIRAVRREPAALICLHVPNLLGLVAALCRPRHIPLVVFYHAPVIGRRWARGIYQLLLRAALREAQRVIVTSASAVQQEPMLAEFTARSHVVALGVREPDYDDPEVLRRAAALREQYGPRLIVAVGRLVEYKGFEDLLAAMPDVASPLVIVGEGPLRSRLENQITSLGLSARVTLVGGVSEEELSAYYAAATVFCLPSRTAAEAFGLVQVEAMLWAKPVVSTQVGSGADEINQHGVTGLQVAPGEPAALAAALNTLLSDPERAVTYGRAGRERARGHFVADRMLQGVATVFRDALRQAKPAV